MADHATAADQGASHEVSATSDPDARMVLRTVYLPPNIDDELRLRAFHSNKTKNDLIREAVTRWLSGEGAEASAPAKPKAARHSVPRGRPAARPPASRKT